MLLNLVESMLGPSILGAHTFSLTGSEDRLQIPIQAHHHPTHGILLPGGVLAATTTDLCNRGCGKNGGGWNQYAPVVHPPALAMKQSGEAAVPVAAKRSPSGSIVRMAWDTLLVSADLMRGPPWD